MVSAEEALQNYFLTMSNLKQRLEAELSQKRLERQWGNKKTFVQQDEPAPSEEEMHKLLIDTEYMKQGR